MAIRDNVQPKQTVSCDLCGKEFMRSLDKTMFVTNGWEDVAIRIYPHIRNEGERQGYGGSVEVEHACQLCQHKFVDLVRSLIDGMRTKVNG